MAAAAGDSVALSVSILPVDSKAKQTSLSFSEDYDQVMAPGAEWKYGADEDSHSKTHAAFRMDMQDFADALEACILQLKAGATLPSWVVTNLQTFWKQWVALLEGHQELEDTLLFPGCHKLGVPLPGSVDAAHPELKQAASECTQLVNALTPFAGVSSYQELLDTFSEMRQALLEHFTEEETTGLYVYRKHMTKARWRPIEEQILKVFTPVMMGHMLRPFDNDKQRKEWMSRVLGLPAVLQYTILFPAARSDYTRLLLEVKTGERIGKERGLLGSWF